jgi:hypothetical protein
MQEFAKWVNLRVNLRAVRDAGVRDAGVRDAGVRDVGVRGAVEQAKNCAMAGVICRRIKQYSSVEEWDERAIQILKSCLPITTPEKNALRNYAIEYNDDATSYFGAGDTENATSCWKMAREIFRAIDYSKGVDIVSWHLETFGTKKSKKPTL